MNKFNFFTFIIVLVLWLNQAYSRDISIQEARRAASSKIQMMTTSATRVSDQDPLMIHYGETLLAWMFCLEPEGYIVVTANSSLPPVIAYATTGQPVGGSVEHQLFIELLKTDLLQRLNSIPLLPEKIISKREKEWMVLLCGQTETGTRFFQQWPPEGTTPTGGWLMSNWTQSSPYNNFCPMDPVTQQRSVAGCPATAMAMILNYFKTMNNSVLDDTDDYYHSYAGRNYWIDNDYQANDFPCFPDLNVYLDSLEARWENGQVLKPEHKAALTFACGVAAKQVFTSSASGTFGVNQAYNAYLRFGFENCSLIDESDTTIYTKLASNMMEARPAHLAIVTPAWDMGHNVVTDGYNTDNYFHLNFGWGGSYNGWYLLPEEIPYGLTVIEGLIIDIFDPVFTGTQRAIDVSNSLNVFPNPAYQWVNIGFESLNEENTTLQLLNPSDGKILIEKTLPTVRGTNVFNLNFSSCRVNLTSGTYIVRLRSNHRSYQQKILIR